MTYEEMIALSLEMQKTIPDAAIREKDALTTNYDGPILTQTEDYWTSYEKGVPTSHFSCHVGVWYQGKILFVVSSLAEWEAFKAFFVFCAEEGMLAQ